MILNAVSLVDGIGTDLPRILSPAFLEGEVVHADVIFVGFGLGDRVAMFNFGYDRMCKNDDFPGFKYGRFSRLAYAA